MVSAPAWARWAASPNPSSPATARGSRVRNHEQEPTMASELCPYHEGGNTNIYIVEGSARTRIGTVKGRGPLDGRLPKDRQSRLFVRPAKGIGLVPVRLRALVRLREKHLGTITVSHIKKLQGDSDLKRHLSAMRAGAAGFGKALADGRECAKDIHRAVQTLRNLLDLKGLKGAPIRRAAEEIVGLLKKLRIDGKIARGSAPAAKKVAAAILEAMLDEGGDLKRLAEWVEKALGGMSKEEVREVVDRVNRIARKVIDETGGEGRLAELAERIHQQVELPLTRDKQVWGLRTRSRKEILETLRKQARGGALSRFLEGMDGALERMLGLVKKAEGKVEILGAIIEAAEAGESDGVVKKMQTYREMKVVMMALKGSAIVDKLPPGVSEMVNWYIETFLAMEKHFEAVAKYAQTIEDLVPAMGRGFDALSDANPARDKSSEPDSFRGRGTG